MSVFMLETSAVQGAADGLNSVVSSLESISDSISGYDTSQSGGDNFNFDGAKSVIAENVKAASIKVKNTVTVMTNVVESHTKLQESLKYGEEAQAREEETGSKSPTTSGPGSYSPGSSSPGSYSPGSSSPGSYSPGSYSPGSSSPGSSSTGNKPDKEETNETIGIVTIPSNKYDTDDDKKKEIAASLSGVSFALLSKLLPEDKLKEFEKSYKVEYSDDGMAMVGDRYVISCDESYGEVGDMIDLKQKDGSYVKCIIGETSKAENAANKNDIKFLTKEEVKDEKVLKTANSVKKNTEKVYNAGPDTEHKIKTESETKPETTSSTTSDSTTDNSTSTSTDTTTDTTTAPETGDTDTTAVEDVDENFTGVDGDTTDEEMTTDSSTSTSTDTTTTETTNSTNTTDNGTGDTTNKEVPSDDTPVYV